MAWTDCYLSWLCIFPFWQVDPGTQFWPGQSDVSSGHSTKVDGELSENPDVNLEAESLELHSQRLVYSPNCQWLEESGLDTKSALLPNGTSLKIEDIPIGVLFKEDLAYFYGCSQCGKVFWEGSHFGRLVSQFKEVLGLSEDSPSFYEQN
ncbi:UNVERIFIED_CONTAM: hypothetical protein K2H54_040886 [Gekko kuhli]